MRFRMVLVTPKEKYYLRVDCIYSKIKTYFWGYLPQNQLLFSE